MHQLPQQQGLRHKAITIISMPLLMVMHQLPQQQGLRPMISPCLNHSADRDASTSTTTRITTSNGLTLTFRIYASVMHQLPQQQGLRLISWSLMIFSLSM